MPRRSRGCQECRNRRIGCDQSRPTCRQCAVTNRACSGAKLDTIIIDQTEAVTTRCQSRATGGTQRLARLPKVPSPRAIWLSYYVSRFIQFMSLHTGGPTMSPLLDELGAMPVNETSSTLKLSLYAVSAVYCGVAAHDQSLVSAAVEVYGRAIVQHHTAITQSALAPSITTISTTLLLSLFETVWPTGPNGYSWHMRAVQKLLALARVELASSQFMRQNAVHFQYQTLFTMVTTPEVDAAASWDSECWSDLCWFQLKQDQSTPNVSDRLTYQLFRLGEVFVQRSRNNSTINNTKVRVAEIMISIDKLWDDYQADLMAQDSTLPISSLKGVRYTNELTAMTVAHFAAAQIMASVLMTPRQEPVQLDEDAPLAFAYYFP
ncbi:hypothetical protein PFICI_11990 [Pestalotiopsis fici W106-1]|uniref:Zn(2)-C6 fungal-type domain-containing protein n=1 Tax=Pestalotiopsis fici (strain W106-1 / CGMCC3.15140) TaxID=1229662 RepID=W3WRX6_PESFW|nr:uncharacterized protein PFICI_11990 [Pestalotiopsis fici W106-1]ETS76603.1 hypothetical protein PFICI_11990 [Pestalotiopsis fici W106-1]